MKCRALLFIIKKQERSPLYSAKPIAKSINNRCHYSANDHRPGNGEHLRVDTENKAFCLCQVRIHTFAFR